jgi:hypothetical protein
MSRKPTQITVKGLTGDEETLALDKVAALIASLREIEGITVAVEITVSIRTAPKGDAPC